MYLSFHALRRKKWTEHTGYPTASVKWWKEHTAHRSRPLFIYKVSDDRTSIDLVHMLSD